MARTLVIDGTGTVVNVAVTSGDGEWSPPAGCSAEAAPQGVGIGWTMTAEGWQPPAPAEAPG